VKKKFTYIVSVVFIAIIIKNYIFGIYQVNGISMSPALNAGDIVICEKITLRFIDPQISDIVVATCAGNRLIKRVVGRPGDVMSFYSDCAYRNNIMYRKNILPPPVAEYTIGKEQYYLLGDNNISYDSRIMGGIDQKNIVGKIILIIHLGLSQNR